MPKVSILIPVYNSELFIQQMFAALKKQTFQDFELIFIADPSKDNSLNIIEQNKKDFAGLKLISNQVRQGLPGSLNQGLEQAAGKYIFRLDTDDLITPDCLAKMTGFLENSDCDGVTCDELKIDENNKPKYMLLKLKEDYYIKKQNLFRTAYGGPTTLIKRSKIIEAGRWDSRINISDDKRLALKLHKIIKLGHIPERLYFYREHGNNMSKNIYKQKISPEYKKLMAEYYSIFTKDDYINDWAMVKRFKTLEFDFKKEREIKYANVILRCALKLAQLGERQLALEEIKKAEYVAPQTNFKVFQIFIILGFKRYLDQLYVNMNIWTKYAYDDFFLVNV